MLLNRRRDTDALDTITSRVPRHLKERLKARAAQAGYTLSAAVSELLEVALDFEEKLRPFRPAIMRLMREERLTLTEAVEHLLWMDVEQNPRRAPTDSGNLD